MKDKILCGLTGVKCKNRIRVCTQEPGKCSGQRTAGTAEPLPRTRKDGEAPGPAHSDD